MHTIDTQLYPENQINSSSFTVNKFNRLGFLRNYYYHHCDRYQIPQVLNLFIFIPHKYNELSNFLKYYAKRSFYSSNNK